MKIQIHPPGAVTTKVMKIVPYGGYLYRAIATHRDELGDSENRIKELKYDFAGDTSYVTFLITPLKVPAIDIALLLI